MDEKTRGNEFKADVEAPSGDEGRQDVRSALVSRLTCWRVDDGDGGMSAAATD